jgi:hypothetical protein
MMPNAERELYRSANRDRWSLKDDDRRETYPHQKFDFLGYTFGTMARSRSCLSRTPLQAVGHPVSRWATSWCGMLMDLSAPSFCV